MLIDDILSVISDWQSLFGAFIGALAPLAIFFLIEKYRNQKKTKEYLYFLERMLVDQINMLIEIENTTKKFADIKLEELLNNIATGPRDSYSVDSAFFPLFSTRSLPAEVNKQTSGSGYIDNLMGKVYSLSEDLPHIIGDMRLQLRDTLDRNEKIAFGALNSHDVQREQYKTNIEKYRSMISEDLLLTNIPIYYRKLAQTLVAVREKSRIGGIRWRIKFNLMPKISKKISKRIGRQRNIEIVEMMDQYFELSTEKLLSDINELK